VKKSEKSFFVPDILYEDNHIIAVNKQASQIVQGDKTGDIPLSDLMKSFIKQRDSKPGNVFLGVVHRLDRPVGGVTLFAKTDKALTRLNEMFQKGEIVKNYFAVVKHEPAKQHDLLTHYLVRNEQQNKSYAFDRPQKNAKEARLEYTVIERINTYTLLNVRLFTGRHHQIRAQLAAIGSPIKGDLKYGFDRPNKDASISLLARSVAFAHPVKKIPITIVAPLPDSDVWQFFHLPEQ
jgi:23S rRNA pseudouridine1911/1915/1917 synthase